MKAKLSDLISKYKTRSIRFYYKKVCLNTDLFFVALIIELCYNNVVGKLFFRGGVNNMIENKKGFTLVELVIVIVIVGILSIISVPIYRGYVEKAIMTEGKVLINAIGKAELAYHVKNDCFYGSGARIENDDILDIDARGNKYFKEFSVSAENYGGGEAAAPAGAYSIKYATSDDLDNDSVEIRVYGQNNGKSWTLRATQFANGALFGHGPNREIVDSEHEVPVLEVFKELVELR